MRTAIWTKWVFLCLILTLPAMSGGAPSPAAKNWDRQGRMREIGRMLSGQELTPEALKHAERMIKGAGSGDPLSVGIRIFAQGPPFVNVPDSQTGHAPRVVERWCPVLGVVRDDPLVVMT